MKHSITTSEPFESAKLGTWWTNRQAKGQLRQLVNPKTLKRKRYLLLTNDKHLYKLSSPGDWQQVTAPDHKPDSQTTFRPNQIITIQIQPDDDPDFTYLATGKIIHISKTEIHIVSDTVDARQETT
jgi:hypothetical protein